MSEEEKKILIQRETSFSGPIPPPETLAKYNAVVANAADRILTMAEKQQSHRIKQEEQAINIYKRGQMFAFVLAIVAFLVSAFAAYKGAYWLAGTIAFPLVVWILSVFVLMKEPKNPPKMQ